MIGSIIGGGLSLASTIYGGITASQAMKDANNKIKQQQTDNQNWYDRRYNEDSTQRADAQRMLQLTQEQYRQRNKAAQGAAAVGGATEESVAATKAANAQGMADTASQIAASGANRQDSIENTYNAQKNALTNEQVALDQQRAQNASQATAAAASAFGNAGAAVDDWRMDKLKLQNGGK